MYFKVDLKRNAYSKKMVLEINAQFHSLNKFIVAFLNESKAAPELKNINTEELFDKLIASWKSKSTKFKNLIRKTDDPCQNPPRPKSKYIFFCDTVRQQIKKEHPEMNIREITCELGRRWQRFKAFPDPEVEAELTKLFLVDKERYHSDKKVRQPLLKNNFRSEYLFFCEQERKKETKLTMQELGFRWSNMKNDVAVYEKFSAIFEAKKKQFEQNLNT